MAEWSDFAITMTRGETKVFRVTVIDRATGLPLPIGAWSKFWFTAKKRAGDMDNQAVFQLMTGGGGLVVIDPPNGLIEGTVAAGLTSGLDNRLQQFFADVQGLDGGGNLQGVLLGKVTMNPKATFAVS